MPRSQARPPKHRSRFRDAAAAVLRDAIDEAGGVEVFAIGDVDREGFVFEVEITCRGTEGAVPALLTRPKAGQVVIHNHPSGILRPSDADFQLAHQYGDEGIGVVIVDSRVQNATWVVEPAVREDQPIDRDRVRAFFEEDLPRTLPGCEHRPGQLALALDIADVLDEGGIRVAEAGTGTGKSLAYLVPAVLWAQANQGKVAIATYTIHLQSQLLQSDIPLMRRAGLDVKAALIKGRNNYVCRRKLGEALADEGQDAELLRRIAGQTQDGLGTRQAFGEAIHPDLWERIESDGHQTLRARCPYYNSCFYYDARREAASSDVLLLNHALLLADLVIKAEGGGGVVPRYDRVILDEGHHLEDAATSATSAALTQRAVTRALKPLIDTSRRKGALHKLRAGPLGKDLAVANALGQLQGQLVELQDKVESRFVEIDALALGDERQLRLTDGLRRGPAWPPIRASLENLAGQLERTTDTMLEVYERLDRRKLEVKQLQPVLDVQRALDRLTRHATQARSMLASDAQSCRWIERRGRGMRAVPVLRSAPIEIGGLLERLLFTPLTSVAVTSATLRVAGRFDHWLRRHGVPPGVAATGTYESPFDYREQALLGLPKDLPDPTAPSWARQVGEVVARLVRVSQGSAFVLCTSYRLVDQLAARLRAEDGLPPVLAQGEGSREVLLRRYLSTPGSVLVGTDSFWEGVSVVGDDLRLVVIPRLPFRVPTEPVAQARYERLEAQGRDPFRELSLPQAILKLRQGFGRLIRTTSDSGAVVILDRRLHDRWYGRLFLSSLPPARRIVGPGRRVEQALGGFYAEQGYPPSRG